MRIVINSIDKYQYVFNNVSNQNENPLFSANGDVMNTI